MEYEKDIEILRTLRKNSKKRSFNEAINSKELSADELDELFLS